MLTFLLEFLICKTKSHRRITFLAWSSIKELHRKKEMYSKFINIMHLPWSILLMSGVINHVPKENFTSNRDLSKLETNSSLQEGARVRDDREVLGFWSEVGSIYLVGNIFKKSSLLSLPALSPWYRKERKEGPAHEQWFKPSSNRVRKCPALQTRASHPHFLP